MAQVCRRACGGRRRIRHTALDAALGERRRSHPGVVLPRFRLRTTGRCDTVTAHPNRRQSAALPPVPGDRLECLRPVTRDPALFWSPARSSVVRRRGLALALAVAAAAAAFVVPGQPVEASASPTP